MKTCLLTLVLFSCCASLRNEANRVAVPESWQAEVLRLVNQARMKGCSCGGKRMSPAPVLRFSEDLTRIAKGHADYLRKRGYITHRGRGGTRVGARASRAGYRWRAIGENIASGYNTPRAVVDSWLESPGHCRNIMDPNYTEMGVARLGNIYVQVLAKPM
ncbi:MAG: hypothetical protein KatS3mg030_667 [Saprospiraceae bacterium]|nr:MAG: hypothetical protein KatS3mg030_667 [Saprospiraceae bacterium]